MEKNMSIHFMSTAAFYKGVRAVLVDKDSFPNWAPSKLYALDHSDIE